MASQHAADGAELPLPETMTEDSSGATPSISKKLPDTFEA